MKASLIFSPACLSLEVDWSAFHRWYVDWTAEEMRQVVGRLQLPSGTSFIDPGVVYEVNVTEYVRDNQYNPEVHNQVYQEIKPNILALAQSLGSPTTQAIADHWTGLRNSASRTIAATTA